MSWDWIKSCFNSNAWYESVKNYANTVSDVVVPVLDNTINKISTVWEQWGLQYSRYKTTTKYKSQYDQMITQVWNKHYNHLSKKQFEELYVFRLVQASIVMRDTRIEYKLIRDIFIEVDRKNQKADEIANPKKEYYDVYNNTLPLGVNVPDKNNASSYHIQSDRQIKIQLVLYKPKQIGCAPNELLGVGTKLLEGHESYED